MYLPELEKWNQCLGERNREEMCEFVCCFHRRMDEQMDTECAAPTTAEFLLTLWNLCLLFTLSHWAVIRIIF